VYAGSKCANHAANTTGPPHPSPHYRLMPDRMGSGYNTGFRLAISDSHCFYSSSAATISCNLRPASCVLRPASCVLHPGISLSFLVPTALIYSPNPDVSVGRDIARFVLLYRYNPDPPNPPNPRLDTAPPVVIGRVYQHTINPGRLSPHAHTPHAAAKSSTLGAAAATPFTAQVVRSRSI